MTNTGERSGADVPQTYLTDAAGDNRMRLLGFEHVDLQPGESRRVTLTAEPRLVARYDGTAGQWRIADGAQRIALDKAADDLVPLRLGKVLTDFVHHANGANDELARLYAPEPRCQQATDRRSRKIEVNSH